MGSATRAPRHARLRRFSSDRHEEKTAVLVLLLPAGGVAFATDRPLAVLGPGIQSAVNRTVRRGREVAVLPQRLLAERDFIRTAIGERWAAAVFSAAGNIGFDYVALLCALRAVGAPSSGETWSRPSQ